MQDRLLLLYRETIDNKVEAAVKGERPVSDEPDLLDAEKKSVDISELERLSLRQDLLLGLLYDGLQAVDLSAMTLVKDPVLHSAMIWLSLNENHTKKSFVENFNPRTYGRFHMYLQSYLRPVVLLQLLIQFPEKIEKLTESSSYFPHRLFQIKKSTINEIDKEIAQILPTLISGNLAGKLLPLEILISPYHPPEFSAYKENRMGKYTIPVAASFKWSYAPDSGETLDKMFSGFEAKREIYRTLLDVFYLVGSVFFRGKMSPKSSKVFKTSNTEYTVARRTIQDFARNQFLYCWKQSSGTCVQPTILTQLLGMTSTIEGGRLIVKFKGDEERFRSESKYKNTTRYLPFCAYLIHRNYKRAVEIRAKNM